MYSYALEQFRRGRGMSQTVFADLLGVSIGEYSQVVRRRATVSKRFRNTLVAGEELVLEEKVLLTRAYIINEDHLSEMEILKEDVISARYNATPKYDVDSPYRIRNNKKEFYKLLNSIPDMCMEDPNSPKLQEIRKMMGEAPIWDNPEELWAEEG